VTPEKLVEDALQEGTAAVPVGQSIAAAARLRCFLPDEPTRCAVMTLMAGAMGAHG
jgi:hypothetical protein